jgi:hypothetical protein
MGTVIEDAARASAWIATALSSSGYIADFTPASLWQIDRFFDEQAQGGMAKPGGLLSQDLGSRLFAAGGWDRGLWRHDATRGRPSAYPRRAPAVVALLVTEGSRRRRMGLRL